ncbi:hypothetical protein [Streptomyces sannanensis]|uniref:hypothetical protein n=1 Tax=Streptomyces sannanensis TaxID=285536 RepID=UPI0031EC17E3
MQRLNDVEGTRSAGLRTIWISRRAGWPYELPEPDRTVPDALAAIRLLLHDTP